MPECDGFFNAEGIPFEASFQDAAVYAVFSADFYDPAYKKWLIQCWFDVTYGEWNGSRYDLKDSRTQMATYIRNTSYATFEALMEAYAKDPDKHRTARQLPKM